MLMLSKKWKIRTRGVPDRERGAEVKATGPDILWTRTSTASQNLLKGSSSSVYFELNSHKPTDIFKSSDFGSRIK